MVERVYLRLLASLPVRVSTTGRGDEALEMIHHDIPDLVILDHQLPGLTGLEVLQRATLQLGASKPPMLIITGVATPELTRACCDAECAGVLQKPIDVTTLRELVSQLIGI